MTLKTQIAKLKKTAATLPTSPATGDDIALIVVHADDGAHEYATAAEALAAHPDLNDPGEYLTVVVPDGKKR